MEFRIADTFTNSLARLNGQEQKAAKTTAFDLQLDPSRPGLQLHRIDKSKDANFWSIRVNADIRIIVHKTAASFLLCYVGHHDDAYGWAERRRIEAHPKTGAIQIVEVRERIDEIGPQLTFDMDRSAVPQGQASGEASRPFEALTPENLLTLGVPEDWLADILQATEDRFLELAGHLPAEAAEALLIYAVEGTLPVRPRLAPVAAPPVIASYEEIERLDDVAFSLRVEKDEESIARWASAEDIDSEKGPRKTRPVLGKESGFDHPDALRRFRTIENAEDLRQALEAPWEKWTVFLHPSQRAVVEQSFLGPARVAGSAGTGKTVVALHRTARLARENEDGGILLTTFSRPLANALDKKLKLLIGAQLTVVPRVTVTPFRGVAEELYQLAFGRRPHAAPDDVVRSILIKAARDQGASQFTERFLVSEWTHVVDAWQIDSAEAYAEVPRLGRKNRMGSQQRAKLWPVFAATRGAIKDRGLFTWPQIFAEVAAYYTGRDRKPFSHIIVDEAQDLGVPELRMLSAIAPAEQDALFFAGDLGQRIFQQPFSWKSLGVDVRGRSQTLKVNYRTSHQIRQMADRLLPPTVRDVDGLEDVRSGTISVFNGPEPVIGTQASEDAEISAVASWIREAVAGGIKPGEIGIFVRTRDQLPRAMAAVAAADQQAVEISEIEEEPDGRISVGTMHTAKGLEFKAVIVMACDDEVLPLQSRVETVADEVELDDVYETERQLFYVACTRARDRLLISGVKPVSEYLADLVRS